MVRGKDSSSRAEPPSPGASRGPKERGWNGTVLVFSPERLRGRLVLHVEALSCLHSKQPSISPQKLADFPFKAQLCQGPPGPLRKRERK